jgi:hypothetical protein
MKKKQFWERYAHFFPISTKLLLIMKLTLFLNCVLILNVSATVYSQEMRLNLEVKDQKIREVLKVIESQTKLRFFFNDAFSDLNKKVSLSANDESLEEVLSSVFTGTNVTYKILENNFVVITPLELMQQKVTGTITDATTGEPLTGVTVLVEGTTIGVVTDLNGKYSIDVPNSNAVLLLSYVGYLSEKVTVATQTVVDVKLTPDIKNLEDIVVD